MFPYFKKHIWIPVITIYAIVELIIDPAGEFCLNDDWAYAKVVSEFVNTGVLKFSFWQGMPDLPLLFIGIFFSKLFGFSFTLLRLISVVSLGIITLIFDYNLKRFSVSIANRFAVLMLFVYNPLATSLSNSFMTDLFQLLPCILAFQFMTLYLENKRILHWGLFILFALIASLGRQSGIVIPIIFAIIIMREKRNLQNLIFAIVPFIISLSGLFIFEYIATIKHILPQNYNSQFDSIISIVSSPTLNNVKTVSYYFITSTISLGLFILPMTISGVKEFYCLFKKSISDKIILSVYVLLIIGKIILSGNIFPFVGNMFYHLGTGPVILTGFDTTSDQELPLYLKSIWTCLNIMSGLSFFVSMRLILNKLFETALKLEYISKLFFVMLIIFYLIPLCFNYTNDRYLLFLIPFYFMTYVLAIKKEINKLYFAVLFIPLFYFSIASTHDYLSLNRARMKATDYLISSKNIPPQNIDGGFEFNGWHAKDTKNYIPSHLGRWWFIDKDDYIVSPVQVKGYSIDSTFAFSSWMSFDFKEILVLKKL
ncbi:MAG TPA: hypothetical protein VN026_05025 [Bacteroidia bacterium]|nr:hypothetical protein [Bacteroidia bacterium]